MQHTLYHDISFVKKKWEFQRHKEIVKNIYNKHFMFGKVHLYLYYFLRIICYTCLKFMDEKCGLDIQGTSMNFYISNKGIFTATQSYVDRSDGKRYFSFSTGCSLLTHPLIKPLSDIPYH